MKIINEYSETIPLEKTIKKYVKNIQKEMNNKTNFTLVFVNNEYIHKLNLEYRDKDYPTDVLSFCEDSPEYLGDIIISLDKAKEQAVEYNHTFEREVLFLITHGYLHLLGYDHLTPEEEKEMFEIQENLLQKYGVGRENGK